MPRQRPANRAESHVETTSAYGLMSVNQLYKLTGWSRITIDGWITGASGQERLPVEREAAGQGVAAQISLRTFIEWYARREARMAVEAARKSWEREATIGTRGTLEDDPKTSLALRQAQAEAEQVIDKAEMVAMEKAQKLGELLLKEPVLERLSVLLMTVREVINRMPKRVAQRCAKVRDEKKLERVAQEVADEALTEIETVIFDAS